MLSALKASLFLGIGFSVEMIFYWLTGSPIGAAFFTSSIAIFAFLIMVEVEEDVKNLVNPVDDDS